MVHASVNRGSRPPGRATSHAHAPNRSNRNADDFLFLRGVAAAEGGIATLPSLMAQPLVASGELVRVLPSVRVNVGGLVLLYSAQRPLARKVAAFRDFVVEAIQREWVV